jgi:hypothetical protein
LPSSWWCVPSFKFVLHPVSASIDRDPPAEREGANLVVVVVVVVALDRDRNR